MKSAIYGSTPRLYVPAGLSVGAEVPLSADQAHYLRSVMRLTEGETLRVFDGQSGEFAARLQMLSKNKAVIVCEEILIPQPPAPARLHLLFAPISKTRMDFLIEKAVELGVTDLHPVVTAYTQTRKVNAPRLQAQIVEAAEQCERLDIPKLHECMDLKRKMVAWDAACPLHWAIERSDHDRAALMHEKGARAFLIGPEGGFHDEEAAFLSGLPFIRPISLGPRILRAETAALACLACVRASIV